MSRLMIIVAISFVLAALSSSPDAFAATHTFTVNIPQKLTGGQLPPTGGPCQISSVRLTLSFATDPGVTISVTKPPTISITEPDLRTNGSAAETWSTGALTTVGAAAGSTLATHSFDRPPAFGGTTPLAGDQVNVKALDPAGYDSNHYQRYEIDFVVLQLW